MKILAVDDNPSNLKLCRVILEQQGHQVLEAKDGREAVALACSELPDLILMDIQMPVMSGVEALQQIRANPAATGLPVIALTSYALKDDRKRILDLGFDNYIAKPIDIDRFLEIIALYADKVEKT
jgi:two-component system cell cycle response regulator DivK